MSGVVAEAAHPHLVEYDDSGIVSKANLSARFYIHSIQCFV